MHTIRIHKKLRRSLSFCLFSFFFFLQSCYSFTGSSLSPETKTIQIKDFPNNAALMNPNLAQQFSTDIQNRFLSAAPYGCMPPKTGAKQKNTPRHKEKRKTGNKEMYFLRHRQKQPLPPQPVLFGAK